MIDPHIIEDLHAIIDAEYDCIELVSPVKEKLFTLATGINSFGLLDAEVAKVLLDLYSVDRDFRRLWGSISTQMEFTLRCTYGKTSEEIAGIVIDILDISNHKLVNEGSFTPVEIATGRLSMQGFNHSSLLNPNDFWIICFFIFRLTIRKSRIYQTILEDFNKISKQIEASANVKVKPQSKVTIQHPTSKITVPN